jgi:hypothetical protein
MRNIIFLIYAKFNLENKCLEIRKNGDFRGGYKPMLLIFPYNSKEELIGDIISYEVDIDTNKSINYNDKIIASIKEGKIDAEEESLEYIDEDIKRKARVYRKISNWWILLGTILCLTPAITYRVWLFYLKYPRIRPACDFFMNMITFVYKCFLYIIDKIYETLVSIAIFCKISRTPEEENNIYLKRVLIEIP